MTDVFLSFLEIAIPISFIIALLLLLTPFLNRRYAAKWRYWIWIVLALRLLVPLGGNEEEIASDMQSQVQTQAEAESEKTTLDTLADGTVPRRVVVEIPTQMTAPIVTQSEKTSNISLLDIVAFIWMFGSLFFAAVHLASYFYYKHQILKRGKAIKDKDVLRLLLKLKRELHIKCKVSVMKYSGAASPMLIGFFRHVLILPEEQYDSQELFFILRHELIHLKRGDIYFKLLFVAANAVHWFNPLVWIMQKEAALDMELSCDERVIQGMGYAARRAYTETLLSTLHKQSTKKVFLSTGFYGGKEIMKKRFKNILTKKGKKNGSAVLIAVILLTVSLGTLVGCSIVKENIEGASDQLETEDTDSKDIPDENIQAEDKAVQDESIQTGQSAADANEEQIQVPVAADSGQEEASAPQEDGQSPLSSGESLKAVLLDNRDFISTDMQNNKINLANIKEVVTDDDSITVAANKFAILDLNNDGEREVILWIQINGISDFGFEILRYQEGDVYGYTLPYREFMDLKTDGTFIFSGGAADSGIGRLQFTGNGYAVERLYYSESQYNSDNELEVEYIANETPYSEEEFNDDMSRQGEKDSVRWYDLTDDNVRAALGQ